jgi:cell division protein ZapA
VDEFDIRLEIAGKMYPVPVKRGDEQEEFLYREAAKLVQIEVLRYKQHFAKTVNERDLLAMVVLHLARQVLQLGEKNDIEPYVHKIQQLTDLLECHLKE